MNASPSVIVVLVWMALGTILSCKWWGQVWTYDCITNVWSDCLHSLQIYHKREPRHRYMTSDNSPDITVYVIGAGSSTDLDIIFTVPLEQ